MQNIVQVAHIIVSLVFITLVMLQTEGSSLGGATFGGGEVFRSKRGPEKAVFIATIVVGVAFFLTSTGNVILGS